MNVTPTDSLVLPVKDCNEQTNPESSPISTPSTCAIEFESTSGTSSMLKVVESAVLTVSTDPADWSIDDFTIGYLLSLGNIEQNLSADFSVTKTYYENEKRHRSLSKNVFRRKLKNGQFIDRKYLCYSLRKKSLFCIPCRLFGVGNSKLGTADGYNDWRNVKGALESHENSQEHLESRQTFLSRSKVYGKIDTMLQVEIQEEINYWRNVLKRVIAVVKKLGSRGLAFRGKEEKFGSIKNGNFMMSLELIAEFDPFLATHIATQGNPGQGRTSYLSSKICDEFISIVATKVRNSIIQEIKNGKYYSIIVDSTPDISHMDQLSFIMRYVPAGQSDAVERFLKFIPNVGHKSKDLYDTIIVALAAYDLKLEDCRGQSYDNAANMSGCYAGLQALIIESNASAMYIPCAAHSLNLVGASAVESIREAAIFFDYLEDFYKFLTCSTARWELLQENLASGQKVVKRVTGTRWSSRYNACSAFTASFKPLMNVLNHIENNEFEKPENRRKSAGLRKNLNKFESVFMTVLWTAILERFQKTSVHLQAVLTNLKGVINDYKSLIDFVNELRTDEMFEKFLNDAKELTDGDDEYEYENVRKRRRTLRPDEDRENEVILVGRQKLKVDIYFAVLDTLNIELKKRCSAYEPIFERFNFLLNIHDESVSTKDLIQYAKEFQDFYKEDIEEAFPTECIHFRNYVLNARNEEGLDDGDLNLLKFVQNRHVEDLFPNVCIALIIFLSMAITNCSAERSFSYLKRLKNYLRSTLSEGKLDDLAILCIEADFVNSINFDEVINEFANVKSRRKIM